MNRDPVPSTRNPKPCLVTGGAGFIGSHLVRLLLSEGHHVRVLDNLSSGFLHNLPPLNSQPSTLSFIEGDVRDLNACRSACAGLDGGYIFHLAAMVSVVQSVEDPLQSNAITLGGTLNMLTAARDSGVSRFVLSSSAAVYGNAESSSISSSSSSSAVPTPTAEDHPLDPQSPYASDKAASEFYCRNFQSLYGLETVVLRYFNVFGPRQSITSGYAAVVPAFMNAALRNRVPVIFGDGRQTRDFVHVHNVVSANLLAARVPEAAGQTFNVATGEETDLLTLWKGIAESASLTHSPIDQMTDRPPRESALPTPDSRPIDFRPARPGEVRNSCGDIRRARRVLGYKVEVPLMEGLADTLESMREHDSGVLATPRHSERRTISEESAFAV